jgi:hypothetical protein
MKSREKSTLSESVNFLRPNKLEFLSKIHQLSHHNKYFLLTTLEGVFEDIISRIITPEEFRNGEIKEKMGLWLLAGKEEPEPIARWTGSMPLPEKYLSTNLLYTPDSGGVLMPDYYLTGIDAAIAKFADKNIPVEKTRAELLWLQLWNIALQRRADKSYIIKQQTINYEERIPLTLLNIDMNKKIYFSEVGILDSNRALEYANLPIEWINQIHEYKTDFIGRDSWWSMPETTPRD